MGKGGGSPQPTQQTVTQTNLPEYARPYFENLVERAQAQSYQEYQPYGAERIAGFTPGEQAVQTETAGMQQRPEFASAAGMTTGAGTTAGGLGAAAAGLAPSAVSTGAQALGYGATGAGYGATGAGYGATGATEAMRLAGQAAGTGQQYAQQATTPGAIQAYMSPYMQNVVDVQKAEALRDAQMAQKLVNLGAAHQGTYGGARQLLGQTEAARNLGQQLAQIQAAGSQKAFEAAQQAQQFGSTLGLQGLQAGLQGVQTGAGLGMEGAQLGMQGAQTGLQGVGQALQGYQTGLQGLQTGIQGTQLQGQLAGQLADIGTQAQTSQLQRLQAQQASEAQQRAMEQQKLDQAYADFLRQRDYPVEQLGYFSNILRGLPVQLGSTATTYAQPPSMMSQLGGAGLGALGLYNLLG